MGQVSQRTYNKLTARRVDTLKKPGRHSDGRNLYLFVDPSGAKRWDFIYRWKTPGVPGAGKLREMGLGSTTAVSLQRAREKAGEARAMIADGKDPISARQAARSIPTFGEVADALVTAKAPGLRSQKSVDRWKRLLTNQAGPLRSIRVDAITVTQIRDALAPIWTTNPETAALTRGYIEQVLDSAKVQRFRSGDNPARFKGNLEALLPRQPKLIRGHHKAMAYDQVPKFFAALNGKDSTAALALRFLILTSARSGEVIGATWDEIDTAKAVWTLPPNRMKAGKEHIVPLSEDAKALLEKLPLGEGSTVIFATPEGKSLSNMAMSMLLRRMGAGVTTHGFRSSFRDWAGETTEYPRELVELALAHTVGNDTELAYRRMRSVERRRKLMEDWALFCLSAHR